MDVAIVTGASTGLGAAISRKLLELGFRVYGLGGNYTQMPFNNAVSYTHLTLPTIYSV